MGVVSTAIRRAPGKCSPAPPLTRNGCLRSQPIRRGLCAQKNPRPFGASIVHTKSGKLLLRALNAVEQQCDPSAHAEVRVIRLATRHLKQLSLAGYTLYTTCEPCPMCMSTALWAGLDRVVYGATIEDANRHCNQIQIPAAEVAARSDKTCIVDGPILRNECYALFTHPQMLRAFRLWSTRKRK